MSVNQPMLSVILNSAVQSRGGSRIPCRRGRRPSGGAPTYDFVKFSQKLHEIEKILGPRGARPGGAPLLDPSLQSSTRTFTGRARFVRTRLI